MLTGVKRVFSVTAPSVVVCSHVVACAVVFVCSCKVFIGSADVYENVTKKNGCTKDIV